MGKKASLPEIKENSNCNFAQKKIFSKMICKKVTSSKAAVHQAVARFQNFGLYHAQKRSGMSRETSPCGNNLIWKIAVQFPTSSCKKIHAALLFKGTDVHHATVSRYLVHDFNLKAFKPAKKLCLSSAMLCGCLHMNVRLLMVRLMVTKFCFHSLLLRGFQIGVRDTF